MSGHDWRGTLVVGGGLAGPAAAIWLARAGRPVRLWERERQAHHKICGEFLSWDSCAWLHALGLDLDGLGAVRIERVRVAAGARVAEGRLGFTARSLTRRTLDWALLDRAQADGVAVERGHAARQLLPDGTVVGLHETLRPERLLIATGKHNLRGVRRDDAGTLNDLIGFKTYFRLAPGQRAELAGHVELMLFGRGYAGLQPVERDSANLCLLVDRKAWDGSGGDFATLIEALSARVPHLARRLRGAVPLLDRPLGISGVPYGFLHRPVPGETGLRIGDQAAVIPSFTGDGMGIALHSGRLAARSLLLGDDYYRQLRHDAGGAIGRALWWQRRAGMAARPDRLLMLARLMPWALSAAARLTRLSPRALERAGLETG